MEAAASQKKVGDGARRRKDAIAAMVQKEASSPAGRRHQICRVRWRRRAVETQLAVFNRSPNKNNSKPTTLHLSSLTRQAQRQHTLKHEEIRSMPVGPAKRMCRSSRSTPNPGSLVLFINLKLGVLFCLETCSGACVQCTTSNQFTVQPQQTPCSVHACPSSKTRSNRPAKLLCMKEAELAHSHPLCRLSPPEGPHAVLATAHVSPLAAKLHTARAACA
jgi:hypothetical protein